MSKTAISIGSCDNINVGVFSLTPPPAYSGCGGVATGEGVDRETIS